MCSVRTGTDRVTRVQSSPAPPSTEIFLDSNRLRHALHRLQYGPVLSQRDTLVWRVKLRVRYPGESIVRVTKGRSRLPPKCASFPPLWASPLTSSHLLGPSQLCKPRQARSCCFEMSAAVAAAPSSIAMDSKNNSQGSFVLALFSRSCPLEFSIIFFSLTCLLPFFFTSLSHPPLSTQPPHTQLASCRNIISPIPFIISEYTPYIPLISPE